MPKLPIILYPDPILKKVAAPVEEVTPEIRKLLRDMAETMYEAPGIGLAAPQVGRSIRAIVIDLGDDEESGRKGELFQLINPEIVEASGEIDYEEGCLSIPDLRETVRRNAHVIVEALDHEGREIEIEAEGLLAICLQHEIDHLNGVLFIDRLTPIRRELMKKKLQRLVTERE